MPPSGGVLGRAGEQRATRKVAVSNLHKHPLTSEKINSPLPADHQENPQPPQGNRHTFACPRIALPPGNKTPERNPVSREQEVQTTNRQLNPQIRKANSPAPERVAARTWPNSGTPQVTDEKECAPPNRRPGGDRRERATPTSGTAKHPGQGSGPGGGRTRGS